MRASTIEDLRSQLGHEIDVISPQPGPQTELAQCEADIAFYGGAFGGGKSWSGRFEMLRGMNVPGFAGVIFRRTYPQITGAGGLWDQAREMYPRTGAKMLEHDLSVRWPSGAKAQFRHLQHANSVYDHQGSEYDVIVFDELTHFLEQQFWYLVSRMRSTSGMRPYLRATFNPDPDHFSRKMVDWYIGEDGYPIAERSGVVRYFFRDEAGEIHWGDSKDELCCRFPESSDEDIMSFTFIWARLQDNKILLEKDPGYVRRLKSLPRIERARGLNSNFDVRPTAGLYWQRSWMRQTTKAGKVVHWVRAWDKAATEPSENNRDPDWTVGVRVGQTKDGRYVIDGTSIVRLRGSPGTVEKAILRTAEQDGVQTTVALWQDPGQAGKVDVDHMRKLLAHRRVKTIVQGESKVTYWGPASSAAEDGLVDIMVGHDGETPELRAFLLTLEAVTGEKDPHDDDADALALAHMIASERPTYAAHRAKTNKSKYEV